MGCIGGQISNYPNIGNGAHDLSNDLYKAGLEDNKIYDYLRSLSKPLVLYSESFMSKLPKIKWA